jgi:hypothetical protein
MRGITVALVGSAWTSLYVSASFVKTGHLDPGSTSLRIDNVGSGNFDPSKFTNWVPDIRSPLVNPQNNGSCPQNIYNPSIVANGDAGAYNVFFGGWDGVSSCHDSVSLVVTEDNFKTFGPHVPVIQTGGAMHVNNPSAIKLNSSSWLMVTTQLEYATNLNKPEIATSTNGLNWTPHSGFIKSAQVQMSGYEGWEAADVNGGNVLIFDHENLHLFFIDFKTENTHSVYHAVADGDDIRKFTFKNVALAEPHKIINDLKKVNGFYLMGVHHNGPEVFYSVSQTLENTFPAATMLFSHADDADKYIVSIGFVVDEKGTRVKGVLYGAGDSSQLNRNKVINITS